MDFSIKLSGGRLLRGFINSPGTNVRAGVIFVHGLGEHTGRYMNLVSRFADRGVASAGVDLPGHGRSDGKRGHIKSYSLTNEMLDILIGEYRKTFPGIPVFLYGHSFGGGIVLKYIIENDHKVKGAVISSPFLKLAFEPPKGKLILASVMKNIFPTLIQPSGLVTDHLSHDRNVVEKYNSDPLVHNKISLSLFHNANAAASFIYNNASEINVPVYLIHGSGDLITSPAGSIKLAGLSDKVTLKIWEGGYHELHNEPSSNEVFEGIMDWLEKQI